MDNIDFTQEFNNNNNINNTIFSYVNSKKWDDLLIFIKKHKNVDYDIYDVSKTYLIEHVIQSNNIKLIKELLSYNVKIDIVDDSNRSIVYNIIKYSNNDILSYILELNSKNTGFNILDIRDNKGEIPINYCAKFKNFDAFSKIMTYKFNTFNKNNDGENFLFYLIVNDEIKMFEIFFNIYPEIFDLNINGESIFHYIVKYKRYCFFEIIYKKYKNTELLTNALNICECLYNFSILHYATINFDKLFFKIFDKLKLFSVLNCNSQDISGNIFYHYFIKNIINSSNYSDNKFQDIIFINNIIKTMSFNINIYNIDGNTVANLLCKNVELFSKNNMNFIIEFMINLSDINIQNTNGNSPLFYLVKNNYWIQIKKMLMFKKMDIFILGENSKTIFDYINKKELPDFIDLITNSYLIQLSSSNNWIDTWDKKCSNIKDDIDISKILFNENEFNSIKNINIKNNTKISECYKIIYNKISGFIDIFLVNKKSIFKSFPSNFKNIELIPNYPNVTISTFYGFTIDILCGLFYLHDKFSNKKNYHIDTSINLIDLTNNIVNCNFTDEVTFKKICEIIGFEIYWRHFNFVLSSSESNLIHQKIKHILSIDKKFKYYVIPIAIEIYCNNKFYSHSNFLIFNLSNATNLICHRFEPHGSSYPNKMNYKPEKLDNAILNFINNFNLNIKYYPPKYYLPKIGFQQKEIYEVNNTYVGDPDGFCASWCIWWCDMLISNPEINIEKLQNLLTIEIINKKLSHRVLIRNFSYGITKIRDKLFNKINININDWNNDTMDNSKIQMLNKELIEKIKSYY
jgi:hypothetical protein